MEGAAALSLPLRSSELLIEYTDIRQYTLFANASIRGTPPVRALFFEFPDEPELFAIDQQFLVGADILVTPVLSPNATSVPGKLSSLMSCMPPPSMTSTSRWLD